MKLNHLPLVDYLHECFLLVDGSLYWKQRPESHFPQKGLRASSVIANVWNSKHFGKRAGRVMLGPVPYRQVGIDGQRYLEHRIIAAMVGICVDQSIDHRDGNGLNNHPSNLRMATRQQNAMNNGGWRKRDGYPGVYCRSSTSGAPRWTAILRVDGKNKSFGTFETFAEAVSARVAAESAHRGQYGLAASRFAGRAA